MPVFTTLAAIAAGTAISAAALVTSGAIIGAVVGGVAAAVTGGKVIKGVLIGGLIGAAAGGLASLAGVGASAELAAGTEITGPLASASTAEEAATLGAEGTTSLASGGTGTTGAAFAPAGSSSVPQGMVVKGAADTGGGMLSTAAGQTLAMGAVSGIGSGYMQGEAMKEAANKQKEAQEAELAARRTTIGEVNSSSATFTKQPQVNTTPISTQASAPQTIAQAATPQITGQAATPQAASMNYRNLTPLTPQTPVPQGAPA